MHILILAQTPPPVHGAALINKAVLNSLSCHPKTFVKHINTSKSSSIYDMQKNIFLKSYKALFLTLKICLSTFPNSKKITYINTSPSGISSIRDYIFLTLSSFRSKEVLAHFHGQLPSNSIFLNKSRFLFRKNITYIFLDASLIPENFLNSNKKIEVLYNFAPNQTAYELITRPDSREITVGFLANMLPAKGINTFLDTCASALRAGYDFSVLIAGGWTAKYEKNEYTKWLTENSDISNKFTHCGAVDERQKEIFFSKIDIFFYPTKNDAFPLVILEAMASGAAILTTDIGAIRNIIADNELVCAENELPERLRLLLGNPLMLKEKQKELRARYYAEYSHTHFERNLLRVIGIKP